MTVLLETTRGAQGDAAILLLAVGLIGLLFSLLSLIGDWMDRRALRRDIARAHQPKPYDQARATLPPQPTTPTPARPFAAAHRAAENHTARGGCSTRQETEWQ